MTREITSYTQTAISSAVTRPKYCVCLTWNQSGISTDYFSTSNDLIWDGKTWYHAPIEVSQLQISPSESSASLIYATEDQAFKQKVLSTNLLNVQLDIWQVYGIGPYALDDGEHLFSGRIKGISGKTGSLKVVLSATGQSQHVAPKVFYGVPVLNYIPGPFDVLTVGSRKITLS